MNLQEMFNTVAIHLITQNAVSYLEGDGKRVSHVCAYRGANGCKCAAGVLIPDDKYQRSMENNTVMNLSFFRELCGGGYSTPTMRLLRKLQSVHDHSNPEDWKVRLRGLAKEYDLTLPDCLA